MGVQVVRDMTLSMPEGQMTRAQLRIAGYSLFIGPHLTQDTTVRVFQGVQLSNLTMAHVGDSVAYKNTRNQVNLFSFVCVFGGGVPFTRGGHFLSDLMSVCIR